MTLPNNFNGIRYTTEAIDNQSVGPSNDSIHVFSMESCLVSPCVFCIAGIIHRDKLFTDIVLAADSAHELSYYGLLLVYRSDSVCSYSLHREGGFSAPLRFCQY